MEGGRDSPLRVERFFNEYASTLDRAYADPGPGGRILRARSALVLELLGECHGECHGEILDAGMGGGFLCEELDRRGWSVFGVDLAPAMVAVTQARLPHLRPNLLQGSILALPFPDDRFDALVSIGALEYTADELEGAVAELSRVLRPAGTAVVSLPNIRAPSAAWRGRVLYPLARTAKRVVPWGSEIPPRLPRVSLSQFRTVLEAAGLLVDTVRPVGVRPLPASLAERLERRRSALASALSVQLVIRARKRA